jgi:uncharacterized protein YcnI
MSGLSRLGLIAALAFAAAAAGEAQAHVTVTPAAAVAGGYQVLRFGVGHGCDSTAATTGLRIEIPPAVQVARPQPKSGWTLQIDHAADGGPVRAVTWRGALPADQFDEFLLLVQLPAAPGALSFPVVQSCGTLEKRWTEPTPASGERPKQPAPTVTVTPATTDATAPHHH